MKLRAFLAAGLLVLSCAAQAAFQPRPDSQPDVRSTDAVAYELARYYESTRITNRNHVLAARLYRSAAELGHALLYSAGRGVPRNPRAALAWLREAAARNHAEAQYRLAAVYTRGAYGVPLDLAAGVRWLRQSAAQGFAEAQYALGMLYAEGHGVPRDPVAARKWIVRAAHKGHIEAVYTLEGTHGNRRAR
jgi:TPR repeat protein